VLDRYSWEEEERKEGGERGEEIMSVSERVPREGGLQCGATLWIMCIITVYIGNESKPSHWRTSLDEEGEG